MEIYNTVSSEVTMYFLWKIFGYHSPYLKTLIGPILDDRLKEKFLKPWKGAHSSHFRVCLSVRFSVRELLITVFKLGI